MRTLSDDGLNTIAYTMLGEAANQGDEGLAAVANVIKNRADSGSYSSDPVKVALQHMQFSAWNPISQGGNDPVGRYSQSSAIFQNAKEIARKVFNGDYLDNTNGALWYHTGAVNPKWDDNMHISARIGDHIFYTQGTPTIADPTGQLLASAPTPMSLANRPNVSALGYAAAPDSLVRNSAVQAIADATAGDSSAPQSTSAASLADIMKGAFGLSSSPVSAYADDPSKQTVLVSSPTELMTKAAATQNGGVPLDASDWSNQFGSGLSNLMAVLGGTNNVQAASTPDIPQDNGTAVGSDGLTYFAGHVGDPNYQVVGVTPVAAATPVPLAPLPTPGADSTTGLISPNSLKDSVAIGADSAGNPISAPAKGFDVGSLVGNLFKSATGIDPQKAMQTAKQVGTAMVIGSEAGRTAILDPMIYGYQNPGTAANHPLSTSGWETPNVAAAIQSGGAGKTFQAGGYTYRLNNDGTTTNMTTGHTYGAGNQAANGPSVARSLV